MAYFKAAKVVAAVPNPPEPDTIYLVRKGEGFDLWATNGIGTIVAYPLNQNVGGGLGVGQTWQNVRASRAAGTTYTNTTNKPIAVAVTGAVTGIARLEFYVDDVVTGELSSGARGQLFAVVPEGSAYRVKSVLVGAQGTAAIQLWAELR